MTDAYTNAPDDQPGLTLDALLKTMQELQDLLPTVRYVTSDYAPLTTADGEPSIAMIPASAFANPFQPDSDHTPVAVLHPDNLPVLQRWARGICNLVELGGPTP